jgi:hypothetical protein
MEYFRGAIKGLSNQDILLGGLFILYSGLDVQSPSWINDFASSDMGKIILVVFALSFFMYMKPVIAILGLVAVYELIRRANHATGLYPENKFHFLPSTQPDCRDLNAYNEYEPTLEQEMVQKMAPLTGPSVGELSFRPELEDNHNAKTL